MTPTTLNFRNLPLIEVALRTSFRTPIALHYETVRLLRERFTEFTTTDEPKTMEAAPGVTSEFGFGELPGVVLRGHPKNLAVTLQKSVAVTRWLHDPSLKGATYPRFQKLREIHWSIVENWLSIAGATAIEFGAVNVSYTDFIECASAEQLWEYFSTEAHIALVKSARDLQKYEVAWRDAKSELDLRYRFERSRIHSVNGGLEGYNLTTIAGRAANTLTSSKSGLDEVHDRLQEFFTDFISDKAKAEWGLEQSNG